jgi:type I restriction enzyme M protein
MDDDKISKSLVAARLRVAKREKSDPDEIKALEHALDLYDADAATKKDIKEAQAKLDLATLRKYGDLTEDDVKALVLDDKWKVVVLRRVDGEVEAMTLDLVARIQELGERYGSTVADIDVELDRLEARVSQHLAAMGVMV